MSVSIRVRRYANGQPTDELIEHEDEGGVRYGYLLSQDNSFQVLADRSGSGSSSKVKVVKVYSASGYLEVSGTRMVSALGTTEEAMEALWAPGPLS